MPLLISGGVALGTGGRLSEVAFTALSSYALAIICFLSGSWWGIALLRRETAVVIMSNLVVVGAWFAWLLLGSKPALLALACFLVLTAIVEGVHPMFRPQPRYYRRLRLVLTGLAGGSLLSAATLA